MKKKSIGYMRYMGKVKNIFFAIFISIIILISYYVILNGAKCSIYTENFSKNEKNTRNGSFGSFKDISYSKYDNGSFGYSCAKGDLNGDGFEELIVGEPTNTTAGGYVWILIGSPAGLQDSTKRLFDYVSDPAEVSKFGYSIAVGDFNGDSLDDIIVGEPGYSSNKGRVFWYNGSAGTAYINEIYAGTSIGGNGERYGESLAAGDVNGDGFDDAIIGIPGYQGGKGRVEIRFGSSSGLATISSFTIDGTTPNTYLGSSVVVGDFDGNGISDFAIGIPDANSGAGRVRTFLGVFAQNPVENYTLEGTPGDRLGLKMASGDVNGDGKDDLLISMNTTTGNWKSYLYFAPFSTLYFTLQGSINEDFGSALGVFDLDYDGFDDVLIGAPSSNKVYVYAGSDMFSPTNPQTIQGLGMPDSLFGSSIMVGDFNNDTNVDLAIGQPGNNTGNGTVHVYYSPDATQVWAEYSSIFRTYTQTLYAKGRDVEDGSNIVCYIEYKSGSGTWTPAPTPQYDSINQRWFTNVQILSNFDIGNYSIRTRFVDSEGMKSAWLYSNDSFYVANIAPSLSTSGCAPSSIYRGESATIFVNGTDPDTSSLTCQIRCKPISSTTWRYLTVTQPGPYRWTANFQAGLSDTIGQYEFQARLSDGINETGFVQLPFSVMVLNNVPVIDISYTSSSFNNTSVYRNESIIIKIRGNDFENSLNELSCTVRYRLNGTIPWSYLPTTFNTDRFEAVFKPAKTFTLGKYDIRINLTDADYTPQNQSSYLVYPTDIYFYNAITVLNNPPEIGNLPTFSALEDEPISVSLALYESDVEDNSSKLTWAIGNYDYNAILSHTSITGNEKQVTFTPTLHFHGLTKVNLTLTDSDGGNVSTQLDLYWGWINHAPEILDLRKNSDILQRLQTILLTFNGTDFDANDTENILIPQVEYMLEGNTWIAFPGPITYNTQERFWVAEYTIPATMQPGVYLFRARFIDTHGANSSWSESAQIIITNIPPSPPMSVSPSETYSLRPTITWTPGNDAEGPSWTYLSFGNETTNIVENLNITGSSYAPKIDLTRGEDYLITLWTVDKDGGNSTKLQAHISIKFLPLMILENEVSITPTKMYVGDKISIDIPIENNGTIDCFTTLKLFLSYGEQNITPIGMQIVHVNVGAIEHAIFDLLLTKEGNAKLSIFIENVTSSEILKEKEITIYSKGVIASEDPTLKYLPIVIGAAIGVVVFAGVGVVLRRKKSDDELQVKREEVPEVQDTHAEIRATPQADNQANTIHETNTLHQADAMLRTHVTQPPVQEYVPQSSIQEEKHYSEYYPAQAQYQFSQPQQSSVQFTQNTQPLNAEAEPSKIEREGSERIAARIEEISKEKLEVKGQIPMDTTPKIEETQTENRASVESAHQAPVTENVVNEISAPSEKIETTSEQTSVVEDQPVEQKSVKAAAEQLLATLWEIDDVQGEKDEYVQMTMDKIGSEQVQPAERKIAIRALPSVSEDFATIPIPTEYIDTAIDGIPEEHIGYIHEKVDVYLTESVVEKIIAHCILYADRKLECMGFMLGDRFKWGQKEYSVVKDVVTTDLDTTAVSVRFKREGFAKLFAQLEKLDYDYIIVGWYHSHPGYSCFLSDTDIETQRRMFKNPHQAAVVCDPVRMELKAFKMVDEQNYTEVSYAVIKEFP